MKRLLLLLSLCFTSFSLSAQTTCLSCKGSGTYSYKARVPVEEVKTYNYSSSYYTVETHVVYDSRYQTTTCPACNGTGTKPYRPKPAAPKVVKRAPAPPSFSQNLQRKYGTEVTDPEGLDLAGSEYYSIAYKKKKKRYVAVIKKTSTNSFRTIGPDENVYVREVTDENGNFFAFKAWNGNKHFLYDKNGQIIYQNKGNAFLINRAGDMWVKDLDGSKVKGTATSPYKMINYKSGRQLSPTITYNITDCKCQQLWTRHQLIDVTLPHLFESDAVAKGITNSKGEMIIPPIYEGVLSCNPYDGFIKMYDASGYIHRFDLKGQLLLSDEEKEVAICEDDIRVLRSNMPMLTQLPTENNPNPKIEISERYRLESTAHPALQGATFGAFDCFDEKGWATVTAPFSGKSYRFHKSGVLTMPSEYYEKHGKEQRIAALPEAKPEAVPRSTMKGDTPNITLISEGGKQGAEIKLGYKKNGKPLLLTIKPEYAKVIPIKKGIIQVQNENGLWGAYLFVKWKKLKTFYIKPQYETLTYTGSVASYIDFVGKKGGASYGIGINYSDRKLHTTSFEKMNADKVAKLRNHIAFHESMPGISGRISDFMQEKGMSPDSISEYESLRYLDKFKYGNRYMVFVLWKKYEYLHTLPPDTRAVGVPVEINEDQYLPIQGADGRWEIMYISTSVMRPVRDGTLTFDKVHYKQLPEYEDPATIFENSCGYFELKYHKAGMRVDEGRGIPFLVLLEEK